MCNNDGSGTGILIGSLLLGYTGRGKNSGCGKDTLSGLLPIRGHGTSKRTTVVDGYTRRFTSEIGIQRMETNDGSGQGNSVIYSQIGDTARGK